MASGSEVSAGVDGPGRTDWPGRAAAVQSRKQNRKYRMEVEIVCVIRVISRYKRADRLFSLPMRRNFWRFLAFIFMYLHDFCLL